MLQIQHILSDHLSADKTKISVYLSLIVFFIYYYVSTELLYRTQSHAYQNRLYYAPRLLPLMQSSLGRNALNPMCQTQLHCDCCLAVAAQE